LVTGNRKTRAELDKEAAKDLVSSFIRVQARDFYRRKMNQIWPEVSDAIDLALGAGNAVDLPALIKQLWQGKLELGE
jgi:hypothetical protein